MEYALSGRPFTAQDAEKCGLVSKVFPKDQVLGEAIKLAEEIAGFSQPAVQAGKEAINSGNTFKIKIYDNYTLKLTFTRAFGFFFQHMNCH